MLNTQQTQHKAYIALEHCQLHWWQIRLYLQIKQALTHHDYNTVIKLINRRMQS